jgi:hypothetical protein
MSRMCQYIQLFVHLDQIDASLNQHRRGLQPWNSEFMTHTALNLPIQYSQFSPNCPAQSPIMPTILSTIHVLNSFESRTKV